MKKLFYIFLLFSFVSAFSQTKEQTFFDIQKESEIIFSNSGKNAKKETNNWLRRWLWNNRYDFNADGSLKYLEKNYTFDYLKNTGKKHNTLLSANSWQPVGPIQIPPTYEPRSCYAMGRINCIAFHPKDSNTFWIGTPGGGIWKTENHAKTWIPCGDNLPSMAISHIAVDPKNPNILFAATGDFDVSGITSGNTSGIIKSIDGGLTWTVTKLVSSPLFASSSLRKIIIHPDSTEHLVIAGKRGIWKTTDSGETWYKTCDSIITDLEKNPKNPAILFAAMGAQYNTGSAGVLRSTDFGETWTELATGIPPKNEISRIDLAISPADPNYIYVLCVKMNTNGFHSLYCSTNGGNNWNMNSAIDSTNNILGAWGGNKIDGSGQGSYDLVLLADPYDKNKIYTGGINIWMSENAGKDWEIASFWIYAFGESIHADHHFADFNPLDKKLYWCNDGGVYRTSSIKPGKKSWITDWIDTYEENIKPGAPDEKFPTVWENLNDGLVITEFYRMSLSKNNINVLAGGSQDNSCYYYNTGNWLNYIPNYDGMETMIDHNNPDIFYGVWQNGGLCKTTDGGKTIKTRLAGAINERGNWITPVGMNPSNSEHIYIGFKNLWESFDGGNNWTKLLNFDSTEFKSLNNKSITIIKTSYSSPNHFCTYRDAAWYVDTSKVWHRVPGELWITSDAGHTWKKSTSDLPLDSLEISSIEYDRENPLKMWVSIYSYITDVNTYLTTDGGETWKNVSKTLPPGIRINSILHQPSSTNFLYAGTNKGVYYCDDSTSKWQTFSENLPITIVNDLELQTSTGEIFAATYGRGIWRTNQMVDGVRNQQIPLTEIEIVPNPVTEKIILKIQDLNKFSQEKIDIRIIDMRGLVMFSQEVKVENEIILRPDLPNGAYFLSFIINGKEYSCKFIVKK